MSRLLPDSRVVVGIFPGVSWIRLGDSPPVVRPNSAALSGALPLLAGLDALLDETLDGQRTGRRVTVIASDSIAAVACLPWRDELTGDDEVRGFALACFDRQHLSVDENWVVHAGFRNFRRMGLAFAIERLWIEELSASLGRHGLLLDRILPVSAWAYWGRRTPRQAAGTGLVLVRETARHSAHVVDRHGLLGLDVEVVAGAPDASALRLLQRVCAYHPSVKHIWHWSCDPRTEVAAMDEVVRALPVTTARALRIDSWI